MSSSARSGLVEVDGGQLAYDTAGEGSPILFVHAGIADHRMWDREMAHFSSGHQTVRFDLRGFGKSPPATRSFSYVEDLRTLIESLQLHRPTVVGTSMGGSFAIDLALAHPDLVGALLLVAPGLSGFEMDLAPDGQVSFEEDERRSKEVAASWAAGKKEEAVTLLRQLWCSALEGPAISLFERMVTENSEEVFVDRSAHWATPPNPPAARRLSSIRTPTSVIWGDRDNPSSPYLASYVAREIPGAHGSFVPGGDHLVNLSVPAAFDSVLSLLLARKG